MLRHSKPLEYGYEQAVEAADYINSRGFSPRVAVTLGSGLAPVVGRFQVDARIPYNTIPHLPMTGVEGHAGILHFGYWNNVPTAILEGRVHCYEGHSASAVAFSIRALALAGVETFVLTCAAGGIAKELKPGALMVFADHLSLQGVNPLAEAYDPRWGERFLDLTESYDRNLRAIARKAAAKLCVPYFEGVYAAMRGPMFETPAEIRALKRLGADAVGMSTVLEVLAARQLQRKVLAIAAISNRAAGLARKPLSHEEVLSAGRLASRHLTDILDEILQSCDKRRL